ncbi:MAG: HAD-IA family hydrolase [Pseudomonadota bacterium]
MTQRLIIFDVDGTLVDSQTFILAAMEQAFRGAGMPLPSRADALGIVGLSLPEAMQVLVPDAAQSLHSELVDRYKAAFLDLRQKQGGEAKAPLYPGALDAVGRFHRSGYLLGIATGKARRGLQHFLLGHGLSDVFTVTQTADDAPSKPHPQMILTCLAQAGVSASDAVIIGDTEFDMAMGRAAGVRRIGVDWGYHPRARIMAGGAEMIAERFDDLDALVAGLWERT